MHDKQQGVITHIQKMSIHDGDGIRTTVFLKGCDMRCKWCHNPETFSIKPELEWIENKCIGCGECIDKCPQKALSVVDSKIYRNTAACTNCATCAEVCYAESHHRVGEIYNVIELSDIIEADRTVFEVSGGGVTISGGEPMTQFPFLLELVQELHCRELHVIIQTNLNSEWEKYNALLPYIDFLMCDLKHFDSNIHRQWTGQGNEKVIENIKNLDRSGFPYCLRTPVVPGVNNNHQALAQMSNFVAELRNIEKYELLPFHPLASYKYKNLGMIYAFANTGEIPKDEFREMKNKYEAGSKRVDKAVTS